MIHWKNNICPQAPFVASIFNYYLSDDLEGYVEYDELTLKLVQEMPGYLGYESMKHEGRGTFISYWQDNESIKKWRRILFILKRKNLGQTNGIDTITA